jgi:hypothetical protein
MTTKITRNHDQKKRERVHRSLHRRSVVLEELSVKEMRDAGGQQSQSSLCIRCICICRFQPGKR